MNPELRDPERVRPMDAKTAVRQKAEQIEEQLKAAAEGLKELQKLMGQVASSDLPPEVVGRMADLRIAALEQSQSLGQYVLLPLIIRALCMDKPEKVQ